eukprot:15437130-Alexandrium_andersonii.AAC.1
MFSTEGRRLDLRGRTVDLGGLPIDLKARTVDLGRSTFRALLGSRPKHQPGISDVQFMSKSMSLLDGDAILGV